MDADRKIFIVEVPAQIQLYDYFYDDRGFVPADTKPTEAKDVEYQLGRLFGGETEFGLFGRLLGKITATEKV